MVNVFKRPVDLHFCGEKLPDTSSILGKNFGLRVLMVAVIPYGVAGGDPKG